MFTFPSAPYVAIDGGPPSTKKTFRIEANAKHRNRPRIISAVRAASMAGRTMDVTTIISCTNLMNESSGLKAHRTLAPANARYASRQMMWGGNVRLPRRERYLTANPTEIAAIAGQKILGSRRGCIILCSVWAGPVVTKINNGITIAEKTHAEIGINAHLSNGVEDLARPNSRESIVALGIMALYERLRRISPSNEYVGKAGPKNISALLAIEQTCPMAWRYRKHNERSYLTTRR